MADIDNCDGSNFLRRACDAGTGGGGGGGSEFNQSLTNGGGGGIGILDYDGSVAKTITVDSSVVRNTTDQVIAGGLTIEKLTSNGPITGQGLDVSGVFTVEGDGSVGGSAPTATDVIAWNGAQWAPATAGGAATSSNLDLGWALNQSLRTSDKGQLSKLDVTGVIGLLSSGNVGIGTTTPSVPLEVVGNFRSVQSGGGSAAVYTNFQGVGGDTTGSQIRFFDSRDAIPILLNSNGVSFFTGGSVGIGTDSPLDYDAESADLVVYNASHAGITIATADTGARGNLRFSRSGGSVDKYRGAVEYDHNTDILSLRASGVSTIYVKSGIAGIGTSSPSSQSDLTLANFGSLCLKETTTPTSDTNFGKLYTKSDNSLYFQDGAGTESAIALGGGSSWSSAPATATSAGTAGDRAYDSNYYYVCVATNTWKRTSLATW